ncbi:t-SNARE VTI1 [Microbotryomycetes sp. JL221]|nr:t-SNARE VTI1 [Microbotryomycetes sp. JL221]
MAADDSFQAYVDEYAALKASIQSKFKDVAGQTGEQRKATLRRISRELEELDEVVDQLALEGKGNAKSMLQVRTKQAELGSFKTHLASLSAMKDRHLLLDQQERQMYEPDEDEPVGAPSQRSRLLQSHQVLNKTSDRLDNAQRTALESETIGASVLENLRSQRTQLESVRDELDDADGSISRATGTIKQMIRLAYRQRVILFVFVLVLALLTLLVLWAKFFK